MKTLALTVVAIGLFIAGCSSSSNVSEIDIKGTITYEGKPIPVGFVQIIPVGGGGVQGYAKIENGVYDTSSGGRARGISSGEHLVKIVGYDGVAYEDDEGEVNGNGTLLFPQYQVKKTFDSDCVFDVQIPSS